MRPGQFYDPAEKAPTRSDPPAYPAASASAPPLSDDAFYASQPQRQYPREDQLPPSDYYDHGAFRQQHSQNYQPSVQYYPTGHHPPPPPSPPPPPHFRQQPPQYVNQYPDAQTNEYQRQMQYTVSLNPSMRRKLRKQNRYPFVKYMLRLVAFHFLNALLGLAAFPLLITGLSSSASLIPMCCFGIVVFRIVLYGVQVLAHFDVLLYNFISVPSDQVHLEKPGQPGVTGIVMAPSLAAFSPMSLMALLYFLSVKFGVALLSAMSVILAVGGLIAFVASVFSREDDVRLQMGGTKFSYHDDPFAFTVAAICFTVIGIALMQMVAKLSKKATKFFCCEPFSTHRPLAPAGYQPQYQQQQQQPYESEFAGNQGFRSRGGKRQYRAMHGGDGNQQQRSSNSYQDYSQSGKQPSGYDDGNTLYPSFANQQQQPASSSAPFLNQSNNGHQNLPLYYNNASLPDTRVQGSHYEGYPTHPPPPVYQPAAPYTPPWYSGDYRSQGYISTTFKLIIFHFFNAVLAVSGFMLIISCTSISIGLIPLCCFGIVLLRAMLYVVGYLAKFDVKLYNYISPPSEHVYVDIPQEARLLDIVGERLSPRLFEFSPLSITAALYFGTIKYAVGVLSAIVVAMNVGLVIVLIAAMSDDDDSVSQYGWFQINDETIDASEHPLQYALVWVCLYVISIALMHLVARISRASTRFFCCEKFSTYRYVHTVQYTLPAQPVNASSYGTC